jgi:hypothetical protein
MPPWPISWPAVATKTKSPGSYSAATVRARARKLAIPGPRSQTQLYQPVIGVDTSLGRQPDVCNGQGLTICRQGAPDQTGGYRAVSFIPG